MRYFSTTILNQFKRNITSSLKTLGNIGVRSNPSYVYIIFAYFQNHPLVNSRTNFNLYERHF